MMMKKFFKNESLIEEHKEVTLNPIVNQHLLKNINNYLGGNFDEYLEMSVLNTICEYVEKYFPTYFTTFVNTKLDENNGYLNFGVTDAGHLSGIPIFNLEKNQKIIEDAIANKIHEIYQKGEIINVMNKSNDYVQQLINKVEINVIKLEKSTTHDKENPIQREIDNHLNLQCSLLQRKNTCITNREKYMKNLDEWHQKKSAFCGKVKEMMNNKLVVEEYIIFVKKFHHDVLKDNKEDDDILIQNDEKFIIMTNANHFTTLMVFRNHKHEHFLKIKPKKMPKHKVKESKPWTIKSNDPKLGTLLRLTPLIDIFSKNNDITYVLIRICIPIPKIKPNDLLLGFMNNNSCYVKKRLWKKDKNGLIPCNVNLQIIRYFK
jgi:hypothetical protein